MANVVSPKAWNGSRAPGPIGEAQHSRGAPVIVDEAHGAHLPFLPVSQPARQRVKCLRGEKEGKREGERERERDTVQGEKDLSGVGGAAPEERVRKGRTLAEGASHRR